MDLPSSTAAAARGKKCHRGIEHWATVGNSGQAGKYQHNGEEQTIDSTAQGTNKGEKTPMCKGHMVMTKRES